MTSISVLAVDDDQVFADALQARLATEMDLGPVAAAHSAREALARLGRAPVDVAIVDYVLGDETGAQLTRRMVEVAPRTRVVMVSASQSVDAVVEGLLAGTRAWLPKTIDTDHLVRVIRGVYAGEMWVDPPLLGAAMPVLLTRLLTPAPDPLNVLTARERQVLDCMVNGMSRAEIAARLKVSGNTVRTHTQNLISKLGVHTSLEAVTLALGGHHATAPPVR